MFKMRLLYTVIVFALFMSACGNGVAVQPSNESNSQSESPQVASANQSSQMPCTEAGSYMGQMVTCTLPQAHCLKSAGYPYGDDSIICTESWPAHTFIVDLKRTNDRDFHYYDGKCLILSGVVTSMHSAQTVETIVTTLEYDTVQVSSCQ